MPIAPPDADASDLAASSTLWLRGLNAIGRSPLSVSDRSLSTIASRSSPKFEQRLGRRGLLVVDQGHQQVFRLYRVSQHPSRRHPRDFQDPTEPLRHMPFAMPLGRLLDVSCHVSRTYPSPGPTPLRPCLAPPTRRTRERRCSLPALSRRSASYRILSRSPLS